MVCPKIDGASEHTNCVCVVDGQFKGVDIAGRGNLARKQAPCVLTVKLAVRHTTLGGSQSTTCDHSSVFSLDLPFNCKQLGLYLMDSEVSFFILFQS